MDRNRSIRVLFGIVGASLLIALNTPQLQVALNYLIGWFTQIVCEILSFVGLILMIWFSVWLIIDAIKAIIKTR